MKRYLNVLILSFVTLFLADTPPALAALIFNNTTFPVGTTTFTALQIGDEVQVSGSALNVTDLEIGVSEQGIAGTADLQAFLYANDGAGGAPGTLLWQSAVMINVALTGGNDLVAFAVPSIAVPNTFTWAIQISNSQPLAAGLPSFDPPSVGSILHGWFGGPGGWGNLDSSGTDAHFMARISVPEPPTLLNVGVALFLWLGWAGIRGRRRLSAAR